MVLELYYKDLNKLVMYVPIENYDSFHINNLRMPED